jgi:hypothetical protein
MKWEAMWHEIAKVKSPQTAVECRIRPFFVGNLDPGGAARLSYPAFVQIGA